jgi:putative peptide zinc metalloprotease protein
MNLAEVLNVALPELPARRVGKSLPRLHPKLIAREQIEGGVPIVVAMVSCGTAVYRFTPEQWGLVKLFDGEHSYSELSQLHAQQTGSVYSEEEIRTFADNLADEGLLYRTPVELNITASQKLSDERQKRIKKKTVNLAAMTFSAWDPDAFLTRLHRAVSFIYTKWFTFLTIGLFVVMGAIFVNGWREISRDTIQYYTFTDKGASDLAEFWLLFFALGFFHETAHGLTCKHFGGEVHRMGFMLIYLEPAFFADITELYIYGGMWPRVAGIIAGIWVELMFCSVASVVWWGTPPGSPAHDFTYKVMLITGVAVIFLNLNPLMKLDGYYLLAELVGVSALKESSTEYLSSWVKRNWFGMPVEVPFLPRRQRWLFASYAATSGLYSYIVLFAAVDFCYNVTFRFSPQWAFLPALALALMIFRSRLRSAWRFMRDFYLDKQQSVREWWSKPRKALGVAFVLLALFSPVWRETVTGRFFLEPEQRAVIRATVPGEVIEVFADEGVAIAAGAPVLKLRNANLEQDADSSQSDLRAAEAGVRQAQLDYANLGIARGEQTFQQKRNSAITQQIAALQLSSPISGILVTPRVRNLVGSFVQEGTELAEIDNVQTLQARIFIPEFEIHKVVQGAAVSLKLESYFQPIRGQVSSIMPVPSAIAIGLLHEKQFEGAASPKYYLATVPVPNSVSELRPGMSGEAKISVGRQSIAGFISKNLREFVQRKIW